MNAQATIAGVSSWKLWYALLGGAVAWTGHLMLAYAISEFGCVAGWGHKIVLAISAVSWMLIAMSVVMIALAAGALLMSYGISRRSPGLMHGPDDRVTAEYVARFGLIANGLFLFIILIQCVPIFFYLGRC